MLCLFPPKILFCCGILWFLFFGEIKSDDSETPLSSCEIEKLLKPILSSPEDRTIQAEALRRRLINLIRQGLDEQVNNDLDEKRSISSLARWNDMPTKRSLQSLARDGYLRSIDENNNDDDDSDIGLRRSLARTDQFGDYENEQIKRSISSLARNGELNNNRQEMEELLDELYSKRNIGSLARDFNFPSYGKRFIGALARNGDLNAGKRNLASIVRNGKRNYASLARSNNLPEDYNEYKRNIASLARDGEKLVGKRNVAALLRQDNYVNEQHRLDSEDYTPTHSPNDESEETERETKRNLASVKAGYKPKFKRSIPYNGEYSSRSERNKREVDYYDLLSSEYMQPVYQKPHSEDYLNFMRMLSEGFSNNQKRFLGSVARSGWPSSLVKERSPDKRHIGSLARLGWLPSFRSARKFNRSGRSTSNGECSPCRETATNGETENDTFSEDTEDKRLLLIPTANNMVTRRFPIHSFNN